VAVIICERHGRQYCVFAAPRVAELIGASVPPDTKLLPVRLELMGEPGFFWCDEEFIRSFPAGTPPTDWSLESVHVRDEDLAFDIYLKLPPICIKCFEEYLGQNGLRRADIAFADAVKE
jgi:hypothetical protein